MRPADQSEYIVQCIREGASMYEDDARKFLAEHDSHVQAQALSAAADEIDGAQQRLVVKKTVVNILRRRANQTEDGAPSSAEPDFFQPGHSYTHRNGSDFHCVTVTAHPQTGERLAMGWHIDSWGHAPAVAGINQWRHEYDGVQAPTGTGDGQ